MMSVLSSSPDTMLCTFAGDDDDDQHLPMAITKSAEGRQLGPVVQTTQTDPKSELAPTNPFARNCQRPSLVAWTLKDFSLEPSI